MAHDLFTPWREDARALRRRTVGRDRELELLEARCEAFARGKGQGHVYLFGPHGVGKSHLVALIRAFAESLGVDVAWIPEDIPATQDPDALFARITDRLRPPAWWDAEPVAAASWRPPERPTLVFVEALDRRLAEMGSGEPGRERRMRLRAPWDQDPNLWVIGTGTGLPSALAASDEPFFGWFEPVPLGPLTEAESEALLSKVHPAPPESWSGRRAALATLAGGSPRVLMALGETCASSPASAGDALLMAVERFTPQNQVRFRDLSAQGQQIVAVLAQSPRELSPAELAVRLRIEPPNVASTARRLAEDGALTARHEGRNVWYRVAEPLFRVWLEHQTVEWSQTRVARATNLVEAMCSATNVVQSWLTTDAWGDRSADHDTLHADVRQRVVARDEAGARRSIQKARHRDTALGTMARLSAVGGWSAGLRVVAETGPETALGRACTTASTLLERTVAPREALRTWLRLPAAERNADAPWDTISAVLLAATDHTIEPGTPWVLDDAERAQLVRQPFLRAAFLQRGRLPTHAALLGPSDLAPVALSAQDPDLGALLGVALVRGLPEVATRVLLVAEGGATALGPNPAPWVAAPATAALITWILRAGAHGMTLLETLTWARSWVDVPAAQITAMLRGARVDATPGPSSLEARAGEALVALGLVRMDVLEVVLAALPGAWRHRFAALGPLARQLGDKAGGPLQPELGRLRAGLRTAPGAATAGQPQERLGRRIDG